MNVKTYLDSKLVGEFDSMRAAADAMPQGAYTTFRTYDRERVLRLEQHIARLNESVRLIGLRGEVDAAALRKCIRQALTQATTHDSRLRVTFAPPQTFVTIEPFTPFTHEVYQHGVACVTVPLRRDNPLAKSTAFNVAASAAYKKLPSDVNEGLMIADDGALLEGMSSNAFVIVGDTLYTENERVLFGVTRAIVLELAREILPVKLHAARIDDLAKFQECFITSVSREIMPVVKIDAQHIGTGTPGKITRELILRMRALVAREAKPV